MALYPGVPVRRKGRERGNESQSKTPSAGASCSNASASRRLRFSSPTVQSSFSPSLALSTRSVQISPIDKNSLNAGDLDLARNSELLSPSPCPDNSPRVEMADLKFEIVSFHQTSDRRRERYREI